MTPYYADEWVALHGRRVVEERQRRGLGIERAAESVGISHTTWRRVERGQAVYGSTRAAIERFLADGETSPAAPVAEPASSEIAGLLRSAAYLLTLAADRLDGGAR